MAAIEDINTRSRLLESLIRTLWDRVLQKKISESPAKAKDYSIPYIDPDNCQECDVSSAFMKMIVIRKFHKPDTRYNNL